MATGRRLLPLVGVGLALAAPRWLRPARPTQPLAYVQYNLYDATGACVGSNRQFVTVAARDGWQPLHLNVAVPSDGFVQVALGNASRANVWFDDLQAEFSAGAAPVATDSLLQLPAPIILAAVAKSATLPERLEFKQPNKALPARLRQHVASLPVAVQPAPVQVERPSLSEAAEPAESHLAAFPVIHFPFKLGGLAPIKTETEEDTAPHHTPPSPKQTPPVGAIPNYYGYEGGDGEGNDDGDGEELEEPEPKGGGGGGGDGTGDGSDNPGNDNPGNDNPGNDNPGNDDPGNDDPGNGTDDGSIGAFGDLPANPSDGQQFSHTDSFGVTNTWVYNAELGQWTTLESADVIGTTSTFAVVDGGLQFFFGTPDDSNTLGTFLDNEINIWSVPVVHSAEVAFASITPELQLVLKSYAGKLGVLGAGLSFLAAWNSYENNNEQVNFSTLENIGLGLLTAVGIFAGGWVAVGIAIIALAWGLASSSGLTQDMYDEVFGSHP